MLFKTYLWLPQAGKGLSILLFCPHEIIYMCKKLAHFWGPWSVEAILVMLMVTICPLLPGPALLFGHEIMSGRILLNPWNCLGFGQLFLQTINVRYYVMKCCAGPLTLFWCTNLLILSMNATYVKTQRPRSLFHLDWNRKHAWAAFIVLSDSKCQSINALVWTNCR